MLGKNYTAEFLSIFMYLHFFGFRKYKWLLLDLLVISGGVIRVLLNSVQ